MEFDLESFREALRDISPGQWSIKIAGPGAEGPETTDYVGSFETKKLANDVMVALLAHLDQRVDVKLSAELVYLKSVDEIMLEWA